MKKKYVACALLLNNKNKLLIQDRKGISKYGEEWSFFGGGIEKGENSKEALIREIQEELGYDISNWKILYLGEIVHYIKTIDIEYHRFLYGIKIPNNIENFYDNEGSGAVFFSLDEVKKLKFNTNILAEIMQLENNFI
ncbi:MAG: NUDIX hydrolase [Candidatus Gracilibacteria bacterium]|nr:NUDIX hydrolase [Candidatus Gracilibacteria bacterium]